MDGIGLNSAVEQLYSGDPADFVATRKKLVAQLREQGDRDVAKTVGALRRPTAVAAAVNALARREDPPGLPGLEDLGERMREAQTRMDAAALKELSAQRSRLITSMLKEAEQFGVTAAGAKEQLTQTFTAALASQDAQQVVSSGQLVNALSYSGFGEVEISEAAALPLRDLQQARLDELARRESERAGKPTRNASEPGPSQAPPSAKDLEPTHVPESLATAPAAEPQAAEALPETSPVGDAGAPARAVYEANVLIEQQALAAVEAARAALAAAKDHASAATRARQAAEDLLDGLD